MAVKLDASVLRETAFWPNYLFPSSAEDHWAEFKVRPRQGLQMLQRLFMTERFDELDVSQAPAALQRRVRREFPDLPDVLERQVLKRRLFDKLYPAPVLSLPFANGWTWTVSFRLRGVAHFLDKRGSERLHLGHDDGHAMMPILQTAEALSLGAELERTTPKFAPFGRLLLLACSSFSRGEKRADVVGAWADAIARSKLFGVTTTKRLAERLVTAKPHPNQWVKHPRYGLVSDSRGSPRTPQTRWWRAAQFKRFAQFLSETVATD